MRLVIGFSDSKDKSFWSWAIKKYLKSDFYHTYLYFPDLGIIWESTVEGVNVSKRVDWLETHKVVCEHVVEVLEGRMDEILTFCEKRKGTGYGFGQYITILLNLKRDNGLRRTICSEFVARAAKKELKIVGNLDKIDPREVHDIAKVYPEFGDEVNNG